MLLKIKNSMFSRPLSINKLKLTDGKFFKKVSLFLWDSGPYLWWELSLSSGKMLLGHNVFKPVYYLTEKEGSAVWLDYIPFISHMNSNCKLLHSSLRGRKSKEKIFQTRYELKTTKREGVSRAIEISKRAFYIFKCSELHDQNVLLISILQNQVQKWLLCVMPIQNHYDEDYCETSAWVRCLLALITSVSIFLTYIPIIYSDKVAICTSIFLSIVIEKN